MNEKLLKYLFDIKLAIEDIDSYFKTEPRNFDNYKKNSFGKNASIDQPSPVQTDHLN
jgi:hypothetical protein